MLEAITDNAGQVHLARRVLAPGYPNIVMEKCWGHQFNLVAKKAVKTFGKEVIARFKFIVKSFSDTYKELLRRSLMLLNKNSKNYKVKKKPIKNIQEIRWNTYFKSVLSVLRCKNVLSKLIVTNFKDNAKGFRKHFPCSGTEIKTMVKEFIADCSALRQILHPINKLVLYFQKPGLNKGHILASLIERYHYYTKNKDVYKLLGKETNVILILKILLNVGKNVSNLYTCLHTVLNFLLEKHSITCLKS